MKENQMKALNSIATFAALAGFSAATAVVLPLCAQELIYMPGEKMGLENVQPPERNLWKARMIVPAGFRDAPFVECREADFFTLEYGKPRSKPMIFVHIDNEEVFGVLK